MLNKLYPYIRRLLFLLEAEKAHYFSLKTLQLATHMPFFQDSKNALPTQVMGLNFDNPVGLAAGLDKNGEYIDSLSKLGFGFIEVGTVTPHSQLGNPTPRLFRLPEEKAIINRMGFNNLGVKELIKHLKHTRYTGIIGINIGKNADTPIDHAQQDYLYCLEQVYPFASYITINISSPNTKNLRQLQDQQPLNKLLSSLKEKQKALSDLQSKYVPLALKIAPDLNQLQIENIAELLIQYQFDGVIATNTSLSRKNVEHLQYANETGGLSGAPIFKDSNRVIAALHSLLGKDIPIIGVGGILSGEDAREKIKAGASLVQLYTGLIYQGPQLIQSCIEALKPSS